MTKVLWKTSSLDTNIASIRYRCLLPHFYLKKRGVISELYWEQKQSLNLTDYNFLILVKTFSDEDLGLVKKAKSVGLKIGYDLCDNIFFDYPENDNGKKRNEVAIKHRKTFKLILEYCDFLVVPTEALKEEVRLHTSIPILVIPDGIETDHDLKIFLKGPTSQPLRKTFQYIKNALVLMYFAQQQWLKKTKYALWFGNSGFPGIFGLTDLLIIKDDLNSVLSKNNATLIVCTDNKKEYKRLIRPHIPRTKFVKWSSAIVPALLRVSRLTILPSSQNSFTRGKSNNRSLLSLINNTPVVATNTSANALLKEFVHFENWQKNIDTLLNKDKAISPSCRFFLEKEYGGDAIAEYWVQAFSKESLRR